MMLPSLDAPSIGPRCGEVERWATRQGIVALIGLDEAGRGPLAGPVVCAAVALPRDLPADSPLHGLDDSKRLSAKRREALFAPIQTGSLAWAVSIVDHETIDAINILRASLEGMRRAWAEVVAQTPTLRDAVVLVDGNQRAPLPGFVDQRPLVKGDSRSLNIAAASILAKVTRDRIMVAAHEEWPNYGFDRHKGYPTAAHRAAIARHGPCPIHRRSFKMPVKLDGEGTP